MVMEKLPYLNVDYNSYPIYYYCLDLKECIFLSLSILFHAVTQTMTLCLILIHFNCLVLKHIV